VHLPSTVTAICNLSFVITETALNATLLLTWLPFLFREDEIIHILIFPLFFHALLSLPASIFPLYAPGDKKCVVFSLTERLFFGTIAKHMPQ